MSNFPPLRKLQFVLAVAHKLHFHKAAEWLNVSQPSMSRQIRQIEREIGFEIFYRDHHFVEPTEAGQSFIADVETLEGSGLEQIPIGSDRRCVVTAHNSSLAGNPAVDLASLKLHPLIVACSDRIHPILYHQLLAECETAGFKPTIAEEVTSPQQAFDLVHDGVVLATLPFGECAEAPTEVKYFPISGLDPLTLVFIYRSEDLHRAEILGELADLLRKKFWRM